MTETRRVLRSPFPIRELILTTFWTAYVLLAGYHLLTRDRALDWLGLVLGSLFLASTVWPLLPASRRLEVSESGISYGNFYRVHRISWSEVRKLGLTRSLFQRRVVIHLHSDVEHSAGREAALARVRARQSLPSNYGLSAETLARMLQAEIAKHGGGELSAVDTPLEVVDQRRTMAILMTTMVVGVCAFWVCFFLLGWKLP